MDYKHSAMLYAVFEFGPFSTTFPYD